MAANIMTVNSIKSNIINHDKIATFMIIAHTEIGDKMTKLTDNITVLRFKEKVNLPNYHLSKDGIRFPRLEEICSGKRVRARSVFIDESPDFIFTSDKEHSFYGVYQCMNHRIEQVIEFIPDTKYFIRDIIVKIEAYLGKNKMNPLHINLGVMPCKLSPLKKRERIYPNRTGKGPFNRMERNKITQKLNSIPRWNVNTIKNTIRNRSSRVNHSGMSKNKNRSNKTNR